jgi:thiamine biosynthesis lipoprotein
MPPIPHRAISRRRALLLVAGMAATVARPGRAATATPRWVWQGTALGAAATLVLHHADRRVAEAAVADCLAEVARLERIFSLFDAGSELQRLNRTGRLDHPSLDLRAVLAVSHAAAEASGGAFDVTVQPLWQLYSEHFNRHPGDRAGPSAAAVAAACRLVDYRRIEMNPQRVTLAPGMAVTLNGIAQGYITDRVAELLRRRGWRHVLINLGEIRALGGDADGTPWRIAVHRPAGIDADWPDLVLADQAVATSSGAGTVFDAAGRHHHLLDPRRGCSARHCRQVTVTAPGATIADALSTALAVVAIDERPPLIRRFPGCEAIITETSGRWSRYAWS